MGFNFLDIRRIIRRLGIATDTEEATLILYYFILAEGCAAERCQKRRKRLYNSKIGVA